jgi:hypothetical protein
LVHRQFTANNSPRTIHREQFTANNSPQGNSPQRQFTAEAIHRMAIHRKNNSPKTIHRKKIKVGQFTAEAIHRN